MANRNVAASWFALMLAIAFLAPAHAVSQMVHISRSDNSFTDVCRSVERASASDSVVLAQSVWPVLADLARSIDQSQASKDWVSLVQYAEKMLLYEWISERSSVSFTLGRQTGARRSISLCPDTSDQVGSAFRLGQVVVGQVAPPRHTSQAMAGSKWLGDSLFTVVFHPAMSVDSALVQSLRDTLHILNKVFESQALGPVVLLLFDSSADLSRSFPLLWADGDAGDYSYSFLTGFHLAFIARQNARFPVHELVHIAMAREEFARLNDGVAIPYLWKEALARAIGGSRGVEFARLKKNRQSASEIRERFDQHRSQSMRQLRMGADSAWIRDVFGAAARISIRRIHKLGIGYAVVDNLEFGQWLGNLQQQLGLSARALVRDLCAELLLEQDEPLFMSAESPRPGRSVRLREHCR